MRAVLCSVLWARTNTLRLVITLQIISGRVFRSTLAMDDYKKKLKKSLTKTHTHSITNLEWNTIWKPSQWTWEMEKPWIHFQCIRASEQAALESTNTRKQARTAHSQTNKQTCMQVHKYTIIQVQLIDRRILYTYISFYFEPYDMKEKLNRNWIIYTNTCTQCPVYTHTQLTQNENKLFINDIFVWTNTIEYLLAWSQGQCSMCRSDAMVSYRYRMSCIWNIAMSVCVRRWASSALTNSHWSQRTLNDRTGDRQLTIFIKILTKQLYDNDKKLIREDKIKLQMHTRARWKYV